MTENSNRYYSREQVLHLREHGVVIPDPDTVKIDLSILPERIAPGVVLHPFTRIEGAFTRIHSEASIGIHGPANVVNSVIGSGSQIGTLGPVTLNKTSVGPNSILGCGVAEESVFLGKENTVNDFTTGFGFRTRKGSLYEEDASSAQHTDTKMTILFPWVTLGSSLNFCDVLIAGGTGPDLGAFSEIGSGAVHFNFTPSGDKATASLCGDAVNGVFLNQERLFIGGNCSVLGPLAAEYGSFSAAGVRVQGKLSPGLHTGQILSGRTINRDFRIITHAYGKAAHQLRYISELAALLNWYHEIRVGVMARNDEFRQLYESGMNMVLLNLRERISQLEHFFQLMEKSVALLSEKSGNALETSRQKAMVKNWPVLGKKLSGVKDLHISAPQALVNDLLGQMDMGNATYTQMVQGLSEHSVKSGKEWLAECAAQGGGFFLPLLGKA